jgi:hypothetical protein
MYRFVSIVFIASLSVGACGSQDKSAAPAAAVPAATPAAPVQAQNTGKILQLQQAGPYTYAEVEQGDGQKVWLAGGHLEAKQGDMLQWGRAEEMRNFSAKSLGRTFERILFVSAWGPAGGAAVPMAPHGNTAAPHPPMGTMPPAAAPQAAAGGGANRGEVKSVATAGGYTYLEVQRGGDKVWVAAPETAVKVGDKVSWDGGMVMQNFNAKSLNRVFDRIEFAGGVTVLP